MGRLELDIDTDVAPEKVKAALLDFTERRPDIWPGLAREHYEVYEVGEDHAMVKEGSKSPNIWAKERYDWSTPGVVRWEVVESNFCTPGSFVEARLDPRQGGGTRIHVAWERTPTTFPARIMLGLIKLTGGRPIASSVKKGLANVAKLPD
jgi:hypothetical protein